MIFVTPIPAFEDNYLWLLNNEKNDAVIVDPGDANAVLNALNSKQLNLKAILITHHHHDHIGGIEQLTRHFSIPVYGPDSMFIPQITETLKEGDQVLLLDELELNVIEVPGHTQDHIAYMGELNRQPSLFCGDTLFAGGCGRLSGGTYKDFAHSLARLSKLPEHTVVFCTHEYTLANLAFAYEVEPSNIELQQRILREEEKRLRKQPTLPSNIGLEKATNPFLRLEEPEVKAAINQHWRSDWEKSEALFEGLRRWKDEF